MDTKLKDQEHTEEQLKEFKIQALQAIQNKPSDYKIDVIDGTMLPEKLRDKKKLEFIIKPPTIHTLSRIAEIMEGIPEEIFQDKGLSKKVLAHIGKVSEMLAVMMHGSSRKPMPEWYVPFLAKNLTTEETILLWQETAMKIDTSFFLPFIQTARLMNPMTLSTTQERQMMVDSIRSPLSEGP